MNDLEILKNCKGKLQEIKKDLEKLELHKIKKNLNKLDLKRKYLDFLDLEIDEAFCYLCILIEKLR